MSRRGPIDREIGLRIKQFRESRRPKLTQDKFGQAVGVTNWMQMSRYECGRNRVPPEVLAAMCSVFKVDLNWLFTGHGDSGRNRRRQTGRGPTLRAQTTRG